MITKRTITLTHIIITVVLSVIVGGCGARMMNSAIAKGDISSVRDYLDKNPDTETRSYLLKYAADRGQFEIVKLLVDRGAYFTIYTLPGILPGYYFESLKRLIDLGALKVSESTAILIIGDPGAVSIVSCDGMIKVGRFAVELLPGNRSLKVAYDFYAPGHPTSTKTWSKTPIPLIFNAESGHIYVIRQKSSFGTWNAWIEKYK